MEKYIVVSLLVVLITGRVLYTNGKAWTMLYFPTEKIGKNTNKILLTLFYLFNAGLVLVSIMIWDYSIPENIYVLKRIGLAITFIGVLHLFNMVFLVSIFYFKSFHK